LAYGEDMSDEKKWVTVAAEQVASGGRRMLSARTCTRLFETLKDAEASGGIVQFRTLIGSDTEIGSADRKAVREPSGAITAFKITRGVFDEITDGMQLVNRKRKLETATKPAALPKATYAQREMKPDDADEPVAMWRKKILELHNGRIKLPRRTEGALKVRGEELLTAWEVESLINALATAHARKIKQGVIFVPFGKGQAKRFAQVPVEFGKDVVREKEKPSDIIPSLFATPEFIQSVAEAKTRPLTAQQVQEMQPTDPDAAVKRATVSRGETDDGIRR
jgi:hypothetical protein